MDTTATILHADLDAFYASVEQLLDPSLRGKPIAVGGGVVLAASYEAKAFGISGGMSGRQARELCPQLIFVSGHFKDYQRKPSPMSRVARIFSARRSVAAGRPLWPIPINPVWIRHSE
jgi:DNA polymerase IV